MTVEETRMTVATRDVGCVAPKIDHNCGPCYDNWGHIMDNAPTLMPFEDGEIDYVRFRSVGPRHMLPEDHVWLCAGHHRGMGPSAGFVWATSRRGLERDYLDAIYKVETP